MSEKTNQAERTVLIIEDAVEDRVAYKRYLSRAPDYRYITLEADNAAAGLALWQAQRPDCVLLDHQLPDRDGLAVLRAITVECGSEETCAVVMLTGTGDTQLAVEAMKAGAHDYLDKNRITAEWLLRAINNAIEKAALRRQLDEQREWLRVTLSSIGDAVIATDTAGRVTFLNPVAAALTGWTSEAAAGQPVTEIFRIVNEETRAAVESPVARTISEGITVGLANHTILLAKDGREIPIDDSSAPIRDEAGVLRGAVLVFRDITERKQAEAKRAELLRKESAARAVAEAANRSKDEFLAVVTHELRSPLNSILGYTRIARTNAHDATQVERYCEIIERNAKVQQKLIEDLLDTARIVSGKLKIDAAPVDLRLVVEEALLVVRPAVEAKKIHLVTRIGNEPQQVIGDAARLQQVAWNLLQNAIKFTPEGGRVELRLERESQHVRLIVSDTGKGMEPEFLAAAFDRFSQQDMSSTRRHGGLGLGLALAKQLVELHGGRIEAASTGVGHGSTFTVTLPLTNTGALPQLRAIAESSDSSEALPLDGLPRLEGVRVLIVDDQEEARLLVANTLNEWGAVVAMAASGQEAETLLTQAVFDVLVCDIAMPDVNGYEVLRRIRDFERQRGQREQALSQGIPAIALTALSHPEERSQVLRAGFRMHVAKPVEPAELIMVIASLLEKRPERRPPD
jgi:PAS domain S-box-containing protein